MRWEQLFADLGAQFAAEGDSADQAEAASRARAEVGRITLVDRLRGAVGHPVRLSCGGAGELTGRLVEVGVDWLLVVDDQQREQLVALRAVRMVSGLGRRTEVAAERGAVARAWDLRRSIRALARDRAALRCLLDDGTVLTGTVDRVGGDFFELAEHPIDEPRRRGSVRQVRAIALVAVAALVSELPALA